LIQPETTVTSPVSSVDLAPTLLALLGFETGNAGFDGTNTLASISSDRKVYFSGWLSESPTGFIEANRKFIYYPTSKIVSFYDLSKDPLELSPIDITSPQESEIASRLVAWRKDTIFLLDQQRVGKKTLFDNWLCRWNNRIASVKWRKPSPSGHRPSLPHTKPR
jgi:hypothetical protein